MTLLKALLPLAALLLLSVVPTETEVVNSIAECKGFFLNDNPPNIPGILEGGKIQDQDKDEDKDRYKPICQTLNDTRTFVTLYDTRNKIPVFSAAKYRGHEGPKPPKRPNPPPWMIEPQLEDNMMSEYNRNTYEHQAMFIDYYENKQGVNKGHLFPSSYGFNQTVTNSTYTLTNIVPQNINFNGGSWNNMEQCIKCVMNKYCRDNNDKIEGFVVIGAQPSTNNNKLNNRVNIPSMLWSAFCCKNKEDQWLASAHWGKNVKPTEEYLQTKSLKDLHKKLRVEVFPGSKCPQDTTIKNVDSNLISSCKCPK